MCVEAVFDCGADLRVAWWGQLDGAGRDADDWLLHCRQAGDAREEPFERLQKRVVAVTKAFEPFDWTKM